MKLSEKTKKFISRTSAKELAKIFGVDYLEVSMTHNNNNRGICNLKDTILSGFSVYEIENKVINFSL